MSRFTEWAESVPKAITDDPLWRVEAYGLAIFVADVAWADIGALANDPRTLDNSDQLYRALCSVGANISEGYSRESGRDRARFYSYALGSAREARGFYFHGRRVIGEDVTAAQISVLSQIIRLLFTMVRDQRARGVSDFEGDYSIYTTASAPPPSDASDADSVTPDEPDFDSHGAGSRPSLSSS